MFKPTATRSRRAFFVPVELMALLNPTLPNAQTPTVKWGKLYGAAAALAIAEAAMQARGPLIVIAQSSREAEALSDEIRFFGG
ncbi:MAG TPA: hypothetical protein VHS07_03870, partial [Candidatus Binataceae bacterium]|nr:hypothetical protein [Candidatus Binataceae bacterium]